MGAIFTKKDVAVKIAAEYSCKKCRGRSFHDFANDIAGIEAHRRQAISQFLLI